MTLLRLIIFLLAFAVSGSAETYYVATNGNDTADGAIGTPWLTVSRATNTVTAGDTVIVGSGYFNEGVNVYTNNGTSVSQITFQAQSYATIVRQFIVYGSYVTVDGFTFANSTGSGDPNGIAFVAPASNSIVQNSIFPITNHGSIFCSSRAGQPTTDGPLNIIIRSNYISGCGYAAAIDLRGYGHIITNNILTTTNGDC